MKKILLVFVFAFASLISANAQLHCLTNEKYNEAIQNDPDVLRNQQLLENWTRQFAQTSRQSSVVEYVIPVVFHILHDHGPENISKEQILDEMEVLNRDYNKLNPDTIDVIPDFIPLVANIGVTFKLAQIDPNGNCTDGIDRIVTPLTYAADDNAKLNPWPRDKYLNIWVAKSLVNASAAAYAYYPGAIQAAYDGVMCRYSYVGSIGQGSINVEHTITHEIGHCFNLQHPWGSTNQPGVACGDDGVSDTPITMGWSTCVLNGSVCNPPVIENVQNFMDYSYCDNMFTEGQKTRMLAALNSAVASRNNLWSVSNLAATGVSGPPQVCSPIADFIIDHDQICSGHTVQFSDVSWNGDVTAWNWSFPGGTPATSTDSAPLISYANAGIYDVTLTTSNATGTGTITRTTLIRVSGGATTPVPYVQDFETAATFPGADGFILNEDNLTTWALTSATSFSGTSCVKINNYTNAQGQIDEWVLPSFDFSNLTSPITITFQVANAQRSATSDDKLALSVSPNCGTSWQPRLSKDGASLSTAGVVSSNFTPSSSSQWRLETASLNPFRLLPNVRVKFTNTSDRGNNTYIDDVNITGTLVSVDELEDVQLGFAIYPNPTAGASTVQFQLSSTQHVTVDVKDILGRTVANIVNEELSGGIHEVKTPSLPRGIYLIDLTTNNKHHVRRLIVS